MKRQSTATDLQAAIENCLPKLSVLWIAIDTYGCPQNAAVLREVIDELQEAVPPRAISAVAMDFVVNGLFRIPRSQVAQLLSIILGAGPNTSYEIVDFRRPPIFAFRFEGNFVFRELDYPLNEGGSLSILRKDLSSDGRQLDLKLISGGLNVMATQYPRHFADFLNETADAVNSRCVSSVLSLRRADMRLTSGFINTLTTIALRAKGEVGPCTSTARPSWASFLCLLQKPGA